MLPWCPRWWLTRTIAVTTQANLKRGDRRVDCDASQVYAAHVCWHVPGDTRGPSRVRIVAVRTFNVPVIDNRRLDRIVDKGSVLNAVCRELIDTRHDIFVGDVSIVAGRAILLLVRMS